MQLILIHIIGFTFLFSQVVSCQEVDEASSIVQAVLKKNQVNCLYEHSLIPSRYNEPISMIDTYMEWTFGRPENSILNRGLKELLSQKELEEMKINVNSSKWERISWPNFEGTNSISLFSDCQQKKSIGLSEPIFNDSKTKALAYLQIETCSGNSFSINVLKREDGEWLVVGMVPLGVGDKFSNSDCN